MKRQIDWDRLLKIRTTGRDDSNADNHHYPYEPTDYCILERLAKSGYFGRKNILVDYGSGKGRVGFFMSYETRCKSIGVEYDERIYNAALDNRRYALSQYKVYFHLGYAEDFKVPVEADRFYFFNPFSVDILGKVIGRVMESYYEAPREILLFFYYPSGEYISYLMTCDNLEFYDEISCQDLFDDYNDRERIIIFSIC